MTAIRLNVRVPELQAALEAYDVMRIERSTTLSSGPYTELTGEPPAQPATLTGTLAGPFSVDGLTFTFEIDGGDEVSVTFDGDNPMSPAVVIAQVNDAIGHNYASNDANHLKLESPSEGTTSSLHITGGTALSALGFTTNQRDLGTSPWVGLIDATRDYVFIDADGADTYYYRAWFYNTVSLRESPRSAPFRGSASLLLLTADLSLATVDVVDLTGKALAGQRITIFPVSKALRVGGFTVDLWKRVTIETDNDGHAETSLIRGTTVRVLVEGSGFVREFVVPDLSTFDMFEVLGTAPDGFDVVYPNLPAAPRRS